MVQTFEESGLTLSFGEQWIVRRYDAHPFYRLLSGRGYRGVDFMLLHRSEPRAVWIEVKNYAVRYRGQTPRKLPKYVRQPALLAGVLADKAKDTERGLRQIERHYRTRWWWGVWGGPQLRFALSGHRWQRKLRERDAVFFPMLAQLQTAGLTRYVVRLGVETAYANIPGFSAEGFRQNLERELAAGRFPADVRLTARRT